MQQSRIKNAALGGGRGPQNIANHGEGIGGNFPQKNTITLNIDKIIPSDTQNHIKNSYNDIFEWKPPAQGHPHNYHTHAFASGEFNPRMHESQMLKDGNNRLNEESRNISITDNNLSLVSSGLVDNPKHVQIMKQQQQADLKKLQLKAAKLLMGQNATKLYQDRVARFNQLSNQQHNTLNNSVDLPLSSSLTFHNQVSANLQQADNHASVNLLQHNSKPEKRLHSNFHIPGHLKGKVGTQGMDTNSVAVNHQSYDRIDHRSLNQFQLFNLRSSKNSKDAPGNIYLVNSNIKAEDRSVHMDLTKTNLSTLSAETASGHGIPGSRKFPVTTKASKKNSFQFGSQINNQSHSIEKIILSKGERPNVTGITGLSLDNARRAFDQASGLRGLKNASQENDFIKQGGPRIQQIFKQAQNRDIEKELESSEDDDEDNSKSQYAGNTGYRAQRDPLDKIMHMGSDSEKRRKRTAKLKKLQQQQIKMKQQKNELKYPPIHLMSPESQNRRNNTNLTVFQSDLMRMGGGLADIDPMNSTFIKKSKERFSNLMPQITQESFNPNHRTSFSKQENSSTSQTQLGREYRSGVDQNKIYLSSRGSSNFLQQWPMTPTNNINQLKQNIQTTKNKQAPNILGGVENNGLFPSTHSSMAAKASPGKPLNVLTSVPNMPSKSRLAPILSPIHQHTNNQYETMRNSQGVRISYNQLDMEKQLAQQQLLQRQMQGDQEVFSEGQALPTHISQFSKINQSSALRNSQILSPQPLSSFHKNKIVEMQVDISSRVGVPPGQPVRAGPSKSNLPKKLDPIASNSNETPMVQTLTQKSQQSVEQFSEATKAAILHLKQPFPEAISQIFQSVDQDIKEKNINSGGHKSLKYSRMSLNDKRRFIQKIDEITQQTVLQNVFIKIWKLLIKVQYQHKGFESGTDRNGKDHQFASQIPTLPLDFKLYEQFKPLIKKTLGALQETEDFVAQKPEYRSHQLFFDRFCFDLVSQLGNNIFKLTFLDIEYIFRTVFVTLSHSFQTCDKDGNTRYDGVKLLQIQSILNSPFDISVIKQLNKKLEEAKQKLKAQQAITQTQNQTQNIDNSGSKMAKASIKNSQKNRNILRSDMLGTIGNSKRPSLRETPKNMKRFGKSQNTQKDIQEIKESFQKFDKKQQELQQNNQAQRQFIQLDMQPEFPPQLSSDQSPFANLVKPSIKDSSAEDSYLQENSYIQISETETGTQRLNQDQNITGDSIARLKNGMESMSNSKKVINTINVDGSIKDLHGQKYNQVQNNGMGGQGEVVEEDDELDMEQSKIAKEQLKLGDLNIDTSNITPISNPLNHFDLNNQANLLNLPNMDNQNINTEQNERSDSMLSKNFGATQNQKLKQFENILKRQTIKQKIKIIQEKDSNAKAFEDPVFGKLNMNFQSRDVLNDQKQFIELAQLKIKRRNNFEPLLNGAISATDGSLQQSELIGQMPPQSQRKSLYSQKVDHQVQNRKNIQVDLLGEFKNYDEIIFQQNMQNEVLKRGLNLQPQEIRILQANKIDRKTILLNYMDLYDQAVQGFDFNAVNTKHQLEHRKLELVKKVGSEMIEDHNNKIHEIPHIQHQQSLDQYSAINQADSSSQGAMMATGNRSQDIQMYQIHQNVSNPQHTNHVQIQKTNNNESKNINLKMRSPMRESQYKQKNSQFGSIKTSSVNEQQPKIVINQDLLSSKVMTPQGQAKSRDQGSTKQQLDSTLNIKINNQTQFSFNNQPVQNNLASDQPNNNEVNDLNQINSQINQLKGQNQNNDLNLQNLNQPPQSSLITQKESSGTLPQNDQSMQNLVTPIGIEIGANQNLPIGKDTDRVSMVVQHGTDQTDSMQNLILLGMTQNRTINVTTRELGDSENYKQHQSSNLQLLPDHAFVYQQHGSLTTNPSNLIISHQLFGKNMIDDGNAKVNKSKNNINDEEVSQEMLNDFNDRDANQQSIENFQLHQKQMQTGEFAKQIKQMDSSIADASLSNAIKSDPSFENQQIFKSGVIISNQESKGIIDNDDICNDCKQEAQGITINDFNIFSQNGVSNSQQLLQIVNEGQSPSQVNSSFYQNNKSQILRNSGIIEDLYPKSKFHHTQKGPLDMSQPLSGEINLQKKALSPATQNEDILIPMYAKQQKMRKSKQDHYHGQQLVQLQKQEDGRCVHFSSPNMDFNFELQVGTANQFKIINATNVQKIDQSHVPYKMDPTVHPPQSWTNQNSQHSASRLENGNSSFQNYPPPASSQMDISVQNKNNFTSMLAKNKAQKQDIQQRSIDYRQGTQQQLENCLILNQSLINKQLKVNAREHRSSTRIRIQDHQPRNSKTDLNSLAPLSPIQGISQSPNDQTKESKGQLKKPEQPTKILMTHEEPVTKKKVIKETKNSIISVSHFKSTLRDHVSDNLSMNKVGVPQRSEITSPNDNSTISQRAHFRRRFMSQEGSRDMLTIQKSKEYLAANQESQINQIDDTVQQNGQISSKMQVKSSPQRSPKGSNKVTQGNYKSFRQSFKNSPGGGGTHVFSEDNQFSPKMENGRKDIMNRTEFGKTRNQSLIQNTNVAHVQSLDTSQGFIEYYHDQEEVDRINQNLDNRHTSRRHRSRFGGLDYSFQGGDYSFRKLKLKNLRNIQPLHRNKKHPQSSLRQQSQNNDFKYGKKKKKQVLIQLNKDLPGTTARKFYRPGKVHKSLLDAAQFHIDLSLSLQHRKIESSLPQQKIIGTTIGTNDSRYGDQNDKSPQQEVQILNIIDMDQGILKGRNSDKRRSPKYQIDQSPGTSRLPKESAKPLLINLQGRSGVEGGAPGDSLRSSFNEEIDGRPGSIQPFKQRDSNPQNVNPGNTAKNQHSLVGSDDLSPKHQTSLYRVDSGQSPVPQKPQRKKVAGKSPLKRVFQESLTISQKASLILEAEDQRPKDGTVHITFINKQRNDQNDGSGSIYANHGENKLLNEDFNDQIKNMQDDEDMMTLNPKGNGRYLDEEEEIHLTMGNANMVSKHLNSSNKLRDSKLNQDIKSIASKEYLRGRSTMNKSVEVTVSSQKVNERTSSNLRDQKLIKESFPQLASTVQVSKRIRKENESTQLQLAQSKLSKQVNIRDFNQTANQKKDTSANQSLNPQSKQDDSATQQTLNLQNTTFKSKGSPHKSMGQGDDETFSMQKKIGLKKNLRIDTDSVVKSRQTAELNKIIDMADAIEMPLHNSQHHNNTNNQGQDVASYPGGSSVFESVGPIQLPMNDSGGFNNIIILDPKNVEHKQKNIKREIIQASFQKNNINFKKNNQNLGAVAGTTQNIQNRSNPRSPREQQQIMQVPVKELMFNSAAPIAPNVDPSEQAERNQPLHAQKKFIIRTNPALHRIAQQDTSSLNTLQNTTSFQNEQSRERLQHNEEEMEPKLNYHRKHFDINFGQLRGPSTKQNIVKLPHKKLKKKIESKTPQGRNNGSRSQLPQTTLNIDQKFPREKSKVVIERHPSDMSKDGLKQVSTSLNKINYVQKGGPESSATEDNNQKRSGVSIINSRSRDDSEMKFSSKFTGQLDQTLENRDILKTDEDTFQSFQIKTQRGLDQSKPPQHLQNPFPNMHIQTYSSPPKNFPLNHHSPIKSNQSPSHSPQPHPPSHPQILHLSPSHVLTSPEGIIDHSQLLELHIDTEDHEKRRVCLKQCCLQNAIQSKLKLTERRDKVARQKEERDQRMMKVAGVGQGQWRNSGSNGNDIGGQKSGRYESQNSGGEGQINSTNNSKMLFQQDVNTSIQGFAKPIVSAPIALVHFADNNLEPWRKQQQN